MPIRWNKFKKKRRDASKRARGVVDNKLLKKRKIDLTAKEREFNELLVNGEVPTKRRKDGTILLREVTDDDIVSLTEIKIKRITKFDLNKSEESILKLEEKIKEIKYSLDNLVDYAINYFKELKLNTVKKEKEKQKLRYLRILLRLK